MKTGILLSDRLSGESFGAAPDNAVVFSSGGLWEGFCLEHHILPPAELREHEVVGHRLMVVMGNSVQFENNLGNKAVKHVYRRGDFKLFNDRTPNHPRWHTELNKVAISIDPQFARCVTDQQEIAFAKLDKGTDQLIAQLTFDLYRAMRSGHEATRTYVESLITLLMAHLVSYYQARRVPLIVLRGKLPGHEAKRILDYIHSHLHRNVGLHELAALVNRSSFHFCRLFANTFGMAPHRFILKLKLEKALELLKQKDLTITHIAHMLGFTDHAHFSNAFKRMTGISPQGYRKF